ncbi:MAG: hypothetical protein A2X81_17105 [Desulfobacterales bacterium GWB2_56_26]|nr:MAG: hypothetical protein A2X81_17105 [Desulfobacterales bacterium GWB2_56_26]
MTTESKNHKRTTSLGDLGELLALKALVDNGFERIVNLNDDKRNHQFADIYAEKNNKAIVISVKTRNKYQKKKDTDEKLKLNENYNLLYENGSRKIEYVKQKYNAEPYWMAIQLDRYTFSIFIGSVEELNGKKSISMKKCEKGVLGKCIVENQRHYFDYSYFGNQKE